MEWWNRSRSRSPPLSHLGCFKSCATSASADRGWHFAYPFLPPRSSPRLKMAEHDRGALASTSVARHLAHGAIGFGLIGAALALVSSVGAAALLLAPAGMVALRGCPTCWIAGLIQTISAGRSSSDKRASSWGEGAIVLPHVRVRGVAVGTRVTPASGGSSIE